MALQSAILRPTSTAATVKTINDASDSSAFQVPSRFCVVTTDQDVWVKFGGASVGNAAANTDFPIWSKSYMTFDFGQLDGETGYLNIHNASGNTAHVVIQPLTQF